MKLAWLLTLLLASVAAPCVASERATICAHYETQDGWSDGYKVEATIATGSEMNQATSSFDYNAFSNYVTIFWGQDQATVIEMDDPYVTAFDSEGKDQEGRHWRVAKTSFCL